MDRDLLDYRKLTFPKQLLTVIAAAVISLGMVGLAVSSARTATPLEVPPPAASQTAASQPVPNAPVVSPRQPAQSQSQSLWGALPEQNEKEYWETKGALTWLPMIKRVVDEAIVAGVIQDSERALFESLMLGVVGVEAGGANPFIKRSHSLPGAVSSDGLTQLIRHHLWSGENPFDPLTNLRAGVRTLARYYRGYGNRWDLALVEHLTGAVTDPARMDDAGLTKGTSYSQRVIQINRLARRFLAAGALTEIPRQLPADLAEVSRQAKPLAPPWDIFDPPDLPFNWNPPETSRAYELWSGLVTEVPYYQKVLTLGVRLRLGNRDHPGEDSPGPLKGDAAVMFESMEAPVFHPRPPTAEELEAVESVPQVPAVNRADFPRTR